MPLFIPNLKNCCSILNNSNPKYAATALKINSFYLSKTSLMIAEMLVLLKNLKYLYNLLT
jgi:hypothetical protein